MLNFEALLRWFGFKWKMVFSTLPRQTSFSGILFLFWSKRTIRCRGVYNVEVSLLKVADMLHFHHFSRVTFTIHYYKGRVQRFSLAYYLFVTNHFIYFLESLLVIFPGGFVSATQQFLIFFAILQNVNKPYLQSIILNVVD